MTKQFLCYSGQSIDRSRSSGYDGSNGTALSSKEFLRLRFRLPSKPEQTKIAEILSTVDRAIEQTEALIAKQQRIKTGLMQDLLTRGIDEHGNLRSEQTHKFKDSPLGRIPVEWEVEILSRWHRTQRSSERVPDQRELREYWSDEVPCV